MTFPGEPNQADGVERLKKPPFIVGSWAALAYVEGTYNPPSRKATEAKSDDFLGIYLSREDPGFGLITATSFGQYVAFHRCGEADSTAEFAAIDAFINYQIPFHQWRLYPVGASEADTLRRMTLRDEHDKALKGLSTVLYVAHLSIRPNRPELAPMFLLAPRTNQAILGDESTANAIRCSLLGKEKAATYTENMEKLRQRASQSDAGKDDATNTK